MGDALVAAGHIAHLQRDEIAPGTHDVDWLPFIGQKRWILITKDEKIRKRSIELQALGAARVKAFVLTAAGDLRGIDQGAIVAKAIRAIVRLAKRRPPFIANITASGYVELLDVQKYR